MTQPTTPCGDCGMPCTPGEYHPYAACLMFKACHNLETVRANLAEVRGTPTPAGEPVDWQSRTRPTWDGNQRAWTPWEPCTKGQAEDYWKTPLLHEWEFQARALYTAPPTPRQEVQEPTALHQVYRCKIKSRRQIDKEIPRELQGWWADVSAGQTLLLRQAVQSDLDRCTLGGKRSKNPDDYMCETHTSGSLVSKIALEYMNPVQNVFASTAQPAPQQEVQEPVRNRYCHANMCQETDAQHEPDCPQGRAAPQQAAPAVPYSIDADPQGIRATVAEAITGALAFGAQGTNMPPTGHWLAPFWESARWEAIRAKPVHPSADTLYLLRRLLSNQHTLTGSEFRAELGKIVEGAHGATKAAPQQEVQEPWGYARRMKSSGWGLCCKREYAEAATDGDDAVKLYTAQPAPSGDAARALFDAGWKACARFCDREDAIFDGVVGGTGCPEFEAAFDAARKEGK